MSLIVVFWSILQSVFFGFALRGLLLAREDRIYAERLQDLAVVHIVESRERRALVRVVGFAALMALGVYSMLELDSRNSLVLVVGLFIGTGALGLEDVLEQLDRMRFRSDQK